MIMNRYWPELVCSKALPPCERQGDRHTPPYPLCVTFDCREYYKAAYSV
jgi:hypothetical protein